MELIAVDADWGGTQHRDCPPPDYGDDRWPIRVMRSPLPEPGHILLRGGVAALAPWAGERLAGGGGAGGLGALARAASPAGDAVLVSCLVLLVLAGRCSPGASGWLRCCGVNPGVWRSHLTRGRSLSPCV